VQAFQHSKDIRLVSLDENNVAVNYVALSHCWGPSSKLPLTTRANNLGQRSQRISFFDLSLTFKDAVKLMRDLGQRYLWIDSLCIVQDDPEDWVREASKMATVYGNALFTLSALSSVDSTYGCRVANPREITHNHRFFDFDSGPYRIRFFERAIHKWHEEYGDNTYRHGKYGDNPLRRRAWTLQERELSTRSIHFSQNLVLWQCKTLKASNELSWHEVKPVDDFQPWPIRNFPAESLSPDGPVLTRDRWYELMEDYMSRLLTKDADKLPALSGLAQSFHTRLPSSQYLAGLWTGHLPHALLWRMGPRHTWSNARRSMSYRAPSWSFLSLDGTMSYESQRFDNSGGSRPEEGTSDYDPSDLVILDIHLQPSGTDRYGAIDKASLLVRGKIVRLKIRRQLVKDDEDPVALSQTWKALETIDDSVAGAIYPDVMNELSSDTQLWCLSVRNEPIWAEVPLPYELYGLQFSERDEIGPEDTMIMGLALLQDLNTVGTFRRVGMIRWVKKSLFSGITPSDFRLQ
jgi:Heterokaryon incompatibility protein (HET)